MQVQYKAYFMRVGGRLDKRLEKWYNVEDCRDRAQGTAQTRRESFVLTRKDYRVLAQALRRARNVALQSEVRGAATGVAIVYAEIEKSLPLIKGRFDKAKFLAEYIREEKANG
jgi:hypothetical protein